MDSGTADKNLVTISLTGCSRCGQEHIAVEFHRLTQPMLVELWSDDLGYTAVRFTHWALCPTNKEPILLSLTGI